MRFSINWRPRLIAALIHFLVTSSISGAAAIIIFFVWFPGALAKMMGGTTLFLLMVCCDLVLGPLISLVIFNTKKSRKELIVDYLIVGAMQLAALIYGVSIVAESRPVFVAFYVLRLEVVSAFELEESDLAAAPDEHYRKRSWWGPQLVAIQVPTDIKEHNELLFSAFKGKDAQLVPKYYRPYATKINEIKEKGKSLDSFASRHQEKKQALDDAVKALHREPESLRWLPIKSRFGFWTALIDADTGYPVKYLPIDPY